jgi:uncharacterized membrane protein YccC
MLALTLKVIGDPQMALFAVFGGFATLVLASFGGSRRDKAIAHLGLALVGSIVLVIGTAVSQTIWLAAVVTIPVAFAIFFAGVAGPNAASGITAALLAYVLPVATPAGLDVLPSRLAGWWLASAASTAAVLAISPRSAGDRLRAAAAASAAALSAQLGSALRGATGPADGQRSLAAKHELMHQFAATPYRPIGLTTADQALANVVQLLETCTDLIGDALTEGVQALAPADRDLLGAAAAVLGTLAELLAGRHAEPDLARLDQARQASAAAQRQPARHADSAAEAAIDAVHSERIALAVRSAAVDVLIVQGRASPAAVAARRRSWYGQADSARRGGRWFPALSGAVNLTVPQASIRSEWFRNSARGAVALAAAVAIADLTGAEHAFWVVLGTLSVLRTNAAATGASAVQAIAGTVVGFAVGAALLLAIGTGGTALWVALPIAVLVAAYAPGTAPFAVGQAAFTVTVLVLFNLLVPVGWTVGLVRLQDVAIGCAVSLVVGALFWPRGASAVVGDDLAEAFRRGSSYLLQAVDWALGVRPDAPDAAVPAISASLRLDDALRAFLAEQGTKRVTKHDLWTLVMATTRLRLTAYSVAALRPVQGLGEDDRAGAPDGRPSDAVSSSLQATAAQLADFYQRVAAQVGTPGRAVLEPVVAPAAAQPGCFEPGDLAGGAPAEVSTSGIWVGDHLRHLGQRADSITGPALRLATQRRLPWWR